MGHRYGMKPTFYHGYSEEDRETLALAELEEHLQFSSEPRTLAEIGKRLSLSLERIRQIEVRALEKLAVIAKRRFTEEERLEFFAMLANRGTTEPLSPTAPSMSGLSVKGPCKDCGGKLKQSTTGRCKKCHSRYMASRRIKMEHAAAEAYKKEQNET